MAAEQVGEWMQDPANGVGKLVGFYSDGLPAPGFLNKDTLHYLHYTRSITLRAYARYESFIDRLRGEGIRHLSELKIEDPVDWDDYDVYGPTMFPFDVLRAVIDNATKVPELHSLDLGNVILQTNDDIKGLGSLTSLQSLALPHCEDCDFWDDYNFAPVREVFRLPLLTTLHITFFKDWFLEPMTMAASDPSGVEEFAQWRSRMTQLDLSDKAVFEDDDLEVSPLDGRPKPLYSLMVRRALTGAHVTLVAQPQASGPEQWTGGLDPRRDATGQRLPPGFTEPSRIPEPVLPIRRYGAPFKESRELHLVTLLVCLPVSNQGLYTLAEGWRTAGREACQRLKILRLGGMRLGQQAYDHHDDDYDEGEYKGLEQLGMVLRDGILDGLVELDLRNNFLGTRGIQLLVQGLHRPGALPHLEVTRSTCLSVSYRVTHQCGCIPSPQTLNLSMSGEMMESYGYYGKMDEEGCRVLCDALKVACPSLKRLGLGGHSIVKDGLRALCDMLDVGGCPHLEDLDLSNNDLGEAGAMYLARWLRLGAGRMSLRRLFLADNEITGMSIPFFTNQPKCRLIELDLACNSIKHQGLAPLIGAFAGTTLRHVCLHGNLFLEASLHKVLARYSNIGSDVNLRCVWT